MGCAAAALHLRTRGANAAGYSNVSRPVRAAVGKWPSTQRHGPDCGGPPGEIIVRGRFKVRSAPVYAACRLATCRPIAIFPGPSTARKNSTLVLDGGNGPLWTLPFSLARCGSSGSALLAVFDSEGTIAPSLSAVFRWPPGSGALNPCAFLAIGLAWRTRARPASPPDDARTALASWVRAPNRQMPGVFRGTASALVKGPPREGRPTVLADSQPGPLAPLLTVRARHLQLSGSAASVPPLEGKTPLSTPHTVTARRTRGGVARSRSGSPAARLP